VRHVAQPHRLVRRVPPEGGAHVRGQGGLRGAPVGGRGGRQWAASGATERPGRLPAC
jgi:hypothetical protein